MADDDQPKEFPDVSQKLSAPKKLSAFEKERQAAHAKEKRAEAENAAALKEFEESFAADNDDDEDDAFSHLRGGRGPTQGDRRPPFGQGAPGMRYGVPPGPRSGPGSLGPLPGPPPPSLKRKRALDEMREAQEARRELEFDDSRSDSRGTPQPMAQDQERDIDAPRHTVQLASLPPATGTEDVKALLNDHAKVYAVRFIPPTSDGSDAKQSATAIATLSADVSIAQIDAAVSALKNRYLGCGFYLSISRHLSSAVNLPAMSTTMAIASSEPFGAEKPRDQHPGFSMRNAPPPMEHRGFAPPDSYDSPARGGYDGPSQPESSVNVYPPLTVEAIKAIHTVVDALLLEPDPERALEIETSLMHLPSVQQDERFAFLYDSRSPAGVYYRFLLWDLEHPDEAAQESKRRICGPERIHEDVAIEWLPPYAQVPFPNLKGLEQVVTDMDYISSEEESDDDGGEERRFNSGREGDLPGEGGEKKHLTPLKRARLAHLLARLPTSNARLRKGDVARVTNFAITHAGQGAEEIVDILLLNVERPLSSSAAARYEESSDEQDEEDVYEPDEHLSNLDTSAPAASKDGKRDDDPSNAKLIGLYLISDILSASSTAGARNAWKYRQLFESAFKHQKTFEHLGKLERELSWGRLKAEQWKRKIGVLFGIWESWSVFSSDVHEALKQSFFEPPLSEEEKAAAQAEAEREEKKKQEEKFMGRFKKVGQSESPAASASPAPAPMLDRDLDGIPMDELDGTPMENDIDGTPMDDLDGEPMDDLDGKPMTENDGGRPIGGLDGAGDEMPTSPKSRSHTDASRLTEATSAANGKPGGRRGRMRAEDMFVDSEED